MRVVDDMRSMRPWIIGLVAFVTVAVGCALIVAAAFAAGDANELSCPAATESSPGFRVSLPDCRAYEVVSEPDSRDTSNVVGSYGFPEGERVYYESFLPTSGGEPGSGYPEWLLATRTASGWERKVLSLPQGEGPSRLQLGAQANAEGIRFTSDFSQVFVNSPYRDPFEEPQLNETTGMGVYRLSVGSGAVSLLSLPDSGELTQRVLEGSGAYASFAEVNDWGAFLAGASSDGGRAFFVTTAKLATVPGTPQDTHEASNEIYERSGGHTYLVGVLPDGSVPNCGAEVGQSTGSTVETAKAYSYGAIAPSGANVVFVSPGINPFGEKNPCNEGGMFLRDIERGTTVRLPGSVFGGRAGTGAGEEEKIFTLGGGIHEYHIGSGRTTEIGNGDLLAYSADGSRVYYLGGEEGIYEWHEGISRLIPRTQAGGYRREPPSGPEFLGGGLIKNGGGTNYAADTRNMPVASPDGSHLLFIDSAQLTEYQNDGHFEAYVYDAETGKVTCISCNPSEAPVSEGRAQLIDKYSMDLSDDAYHTPSPPFISGDGSRAVFETTEALLPQDVNGTEDVYEWERVGTNGCEESSTTYNTVIEGCVYLLSSGLGTEVHNQSGKTDGTHLVGASEDLKDVYMVSIDKLLPGVDNAYKLYDVRVDGGFPYTPASRGCEATSCKLLSGEPAPLGESATEAFAGPGDVKSVATRGGRKLAEAARKRRLTRALRACRRLRDRHRRVVCERVARRRYGAHAGRVARHRDEGRSK